MTVQMLLTTSVHDLSQSQPVIFVILTLVLLLGFVVACVIGWYSWEIQKRFKL